MNRLTLVIATLLAAHLALASTEALADRDRDRKQAELDAACEAFYSDFGAQSGNRAPLFYDLPECVEAFDFQNSHRRR